MLTKLEQHKLDALQQKYPNITTSEAALAGAIQAEQAETTGEWAIGQNSFVFSTRAVPDLLKLAELLEKAGK